jgi:hypothetical protein
MQYPGALEDQRTQALSTLQRPFYYWLFGFAVGLAIGAILVLSNRM